MNSTNEGFDKLSSCSSNSLFTIQSKLRGPNCSTLPLLQEICACYDFFRRISSSQCYQIYLSLLVSFKVTLFSLPLHTSPLHKSQITTDQPWTMLFDNLEFWILEDSQVKHEKNGSYFNGLSLSE